MKKFLSLLLAGVMTLAMAGTVLADPCTSSLAETDNSYIYNTILGDNWYYGYLLNKYHGTGNGYGTGFWYNGQWYWLGNLDDTKDDTIDSGFGVDKDWMIPSDLTAKCPECDSSTIRTYQVYFTSSDKGANWKQWIYCDKHGGQYVNTSSNVKPILPTDATFTISTSTGIGGSISISNATNSFGTYTVKKGDCAQVSITPDYGYIVDAVYLNGYYMGKTESFSLDNICNNYSVRATFRRIDTTRKYTITATTAGSGDVYAVVNGASVGKMSTLIGSYADKVTLRFVPVSDNYKVESVTINGVNVGAVSSYEVGRMYADMNVKATFTWVCPYTDVAKEHLSAIEYVTEIDVMGSPNQHFDTDKFCGTKSVTVKAMACYLAELSDVDDSLDTVADRLAWATKKGLIGEKEELDVNATWTRACDMLNAFVRNLEKDSKVTFTALTNAKTAYDVASAMKLVTEVSYKANNTINRYDMAEICYAVSQLATK